MKTMCLLGYHQNGFVATHALGQVKLRHVKQITKNNFLSNCLKFSEISYSRTLAKSSSDRFRVYLSSLALLVELICKGAYDYHYHRHSNHYHHQHCRYHKQ